MVLKAENRSKIGKLDSWGPAIFILVVPLRLENSARNQDRRGGGSW